MLIINYLLLIIISYVLKNGQLKARIFWQICENLISTQQSFLGPPWVKLHPPRKNQALGTTRLPPKSAFLTPKCLNAFPGHSGRKREKIKLKTEFKKSYYRSQSVLKRFIQKLKKKLYHKSQFTLKKMNYNCQFVLKSFIQKVKKILN